MNLQKIFFLCYKVNAVTMLSTRATNKKFQAWILCLLGLKMKAFFQNICISFTPNDLLREVKTQLTYESLTYSSNNKGKNQPGHQHSLISAFVFLYSKVSYLNLLQANFHFLASLGS